MLTRSTEQMKLLCLLNSREARNAIINKFLSKKSDGFENAYFSTLYHSGDIQWRTNEYNIIARQCLKEGLPDFNLLQNFFDRFFVINGMTIHAHEEYLEEYNAICRDVHPYCIVAYAMAELLEKEEISPDNLENISENITEMAISHTHTRKYAENHLHLGGASNNNGALIHILEKGIDGTFQIKKLPIELKINIPPNEITHECYIYRELFLCFNAMISGMADKNTAIHDFKRTIEKIVKGVFASEIEPLNFNHIASDKFNFSLATHSRQLLKIAAKQYVKSYSDSALLLYLTALFTFCHEHEEIKETLHLMISWFLHQMNIFRSGMIMSHGNGLNQFVEYYSSSLRKIGSAPARDMGSIRNILVGGTKNMELRSGEPVKPQDLGIVLKEIGKTLKTKHSEYTHCHDNNSIWSKMPHPSQQSVLFDCGYHFIKSKSANSKFPPHIRHRNKYFQLYKSARDVLKFFKTANNRVDLSKTLKSDDDIFRHDNRNELDRFTIDARLLLRTLDAAGDENLVPPEVFSPFARWIRTRSLNLTCRSMSKKMRRLRFAFHAGEDFCHIVSGMRRIDETIKFMEYERGDRLGHALAIGLDPIEWVRGKSELIVPMHELFDNFVWLWKTSIDMTPLYPAANQWTDYYAQEVLFLGKKLYPAELRNASPIDYYNAWYLRRNNPLYIDRNMRELMSEFVPDFIGKDTIDQNAKLIHDAYIHDPGVVKNESKPVVLRHDQFFKHHVDNSLNEKIYVITDQEACFWSAVQDYMLQQCSTKGIIIEANPSSNVYIGDLDRYHKHPIFRWHPIKDELLKPGGQYNEFGLRKGPVDVCVNTDDPSMFSTTLQNEFKLLGNSAGNQFEYGSDEIDKWLEKLRLKGIKIFEDNYICPYETNS